MASSQSYSTRNTDSGTFTDLKQICPVITSFNKYKLPLLKEVIVLVRHYAETSHNYDGATLLVAKEIYQHWVQANVYPITTPAIRKRLEKHVKEFRTLSRQSENSRGATWIKRYNTFVDSCEKLYDVFWFHDYYFIFHNDL